VHSLCTWLIITLAPSDASLSSYCSLVLTLDFADNAGPIPAKSRVTAFVSDDDGFRVECWEIGVLVESISSTPQHCDSKGMPRRTQMGAGKGEISGIEFMTWPSSATLYPPPLGYANTALDLSAKPKYVALSSRLVPMATDEQITDSPFLAYSPSRMA